ncbi:MAG: MupG family TIM beta-alpha barrel fold protein [Acidaminococcus sp.]|nr:MupG family TIM beta-alpha barrel fold protein [Acidaminococcus sp.]
MTLHKGISLYPGLGMPLDDMLQRLDEAAGLGVDRLFLSFHIPETDPAAFDRQVAPLLSRARELGLATVGDLVPGKPVPADLTSLRLDDGFTPEAVAALQRDYPDRTLVLNASAVTEDQLEALQKAGVDFAKVEALHNFYPHPHTGISVPYFLKQNALLRQYGIPVGAFVASQAGKRGPLQEGLPTLEQDRHRSVSIGARQLAALGAGTLYIGDDGPSREELQALCRLEEGVLELTLEVFQWRPYHDILATHVYETRPEEAEEVIRTANSRALWKGVDIPEIPFRRCHPGDVTLDNGRYGRYAGELEICKTELPADKRVDVLGRIPAEEQFLLQYLTGGKKFRFRPVARLTR